MKTKISPLLEDQAWIALWDNDLERAGELYSKAIRARSFYQKVWPLNAVLDVQLAFMNLRQGDFSKAAKFYGKAAGPWGFPFIKDFSSRQKQLEMFEGIQPYIISGDSIVEIDFLKLDPLPLVSASIDGSPPLNFILDTGAEEIFLDNAVAINIGIQAVGSTMITKGSAGGSGASMAYGKIDEMKIGGMLVENIPVAIIDMENISNKVFSGFQVDGIIGTRFLMRFLSTIDYKNKKLILRKASEENKRNFQNSLEEKACKKIPFILVATHLMFAEGSFNGGNYGKYFIDTGLAGGGILSSEERMKESGVPIDWSKSIVGAGAGGDAEGLKVFVNEVSLGVGENRIVKSDLKGVILKEELDLLNDSQMGVDVKGLISHEFFKDSALTFDFASMLLIIDE